MGPVGDGAVSGGAVRLVAGCGSSSWKPDEGFMKYKKIPWGVTIQESACDLLLGSRTSQEGLMSMKDQKPPDK